MLHYTQYIYIDWFCLIFIVSTINQFEIYIKICKKNKIIKKKNVRANLFLLMVIIKYKLFVCWLFISKSNAKKWSNSRKRQLLNFKNIKLANKKFSYIERDNLTNFDQVIAQAIFVKSEICKIVYLSLIVFLL